MRKYIHECPEWPRFRYEQTKLLPLVAEVRHRQGRLIGKMAGLGFQQRAEASLSNLTAEIIKSNAIEGNFLDVDEVRSLIARRLGMDAGGVTLASRDVEGVVEMMLDATRGFASTLTRERLFGWHACLFPYGRSGMRKIGFFTEFNG